MRNLHIIKYSKYLHIYQVRFWPSALAQMNQRSCGRDQLKRRSSFVGTTVHGGFAVRRLRMQDQQGGLKGQIQIWKKNTKVLHYCYGDSYIQHTKQNNSVFRVTVNVMCEMNVASSSSSLVITVKQKTLGRTPVTPCYCFTFSKNMPQQKFACFTEICYHTKFQDHTLT